MSSHTRREYNRSILKSCLEQLKSNEPHDQLSGIISASYIIEQTLKSLVERFNPLLYFDGKINEEVAVRISRRQMTVSESVEFNSIKATKALAYAVELKPGLGKHKANIEELFKRRNEVVHSVKDISFDSEITANTAVSALRASKSLITKYLGIKPNEFVPMSSKEFVKFEKAAYEKRIKVLSAEIDSFRKFFNTLTINDVELRIKTKSISGRDMVIEDTLKCPACEKLAFDKVVEVDWEWEHGEVCPVTSVMLKCRVCGLELGEYDYALYILENSTVLKKS